MIVTKVKRPKNPTDVKFYQTKVKRESEIEVTGPCSFFVDFDKLRDEITLKFKIQPETYVSVNQKRR